MTTFERIKYLCDRRGISVKELGITLGLGENAIYQWKRRTPGIDKIEKVADYFNVSVDYLIGRNVPEWASQSEVLELTNFLEKDAAMSFGGENLTVEEEQRVRDILTTIFWEKLNKRKQEKD